MPYADAVCPSRAGSADYNAGTTTTQLPPLHSSLMKGVSEMKFAKQLVPVNVVKFRTHERTPVQVPYEDAVRPSRAGFAVLYVIAPLVWHSHNHDILGPKKIFSPDLCPKSIPVES